MDSEYDRKKYDRKKVVDLMLQNIGAHLEKNVQARIQAEKDSRTNLIRSQALSVYPQYTNILHKALVNTARSTGVLAPKSPMDIISQSPIGIHEGRPVLRYRVYCDDYRPHARNILQSELDRVCSVYGIYPVVIAIRENFSILDIALLPV